MIILASRSTTRNSLLSLAGVNFVAQSPVFDERDGITTFREASGSSLALHLAHEKARSISQGNTEAIVIGADQTLHCDGELYHKPLTRGGARSQLQKLRGRTHSLTSAVTCLCREQPLWHHVAKAFITLRNFSDAALDHYLDECGDDILQAVGSYHYEGAGIQLMENVRGDYHVILGFPVLPLLGFLRSQGYIAI